MFVPNNQTERMKQRFAASEIIYRHEWQEWCVNWLFLQDHRLLSSSWKNYSYQVIKILYKIAYLYTDCSFINVVPRWHEAS